MSKTTTQRRIRLASHGVIANYLNELASSPAPAARRRPAEAPVRALRPAPAKRPEPRVDVPVAA